MRFSLPAHWAGAALMLMLPAACLGAAPAETTPAAGEHGPAYVSPGVPHPGSDQIFWVPTFAQAE